MNAVQGFVKLACLLSLVCLVHGEKLCHKKVDVVFAVDGTGTVGWYWGFKSVKKFADEVAKSFEIGDHAAKIGMLQFSRKARRELFLTGDEKDMSTTIKKAPYVGGGVLVRTDQALRMAREDMFSSENGARQNVPKLVILISGGKDSDSDETKKQAELNHQAGIKTVAVGMGSKPSEDELTIIASEPPYMVKSYKDLHPMVQDLARKSCALV